MLAQLKLLAAGTTLELLFASVVAALESAPSVFTAAPWKVPSAGACSEGEKGDVGCSAGEETSGGATAALSILSRWLRGALMVGKSAGTSLTGGVACSVMQFRRMVTAMMNIRMAIQCSVLCNLFGASVTALSAVLRAAYAGRQCVTNSSTSAGMACNSCAHHIVKIYECSVVHTGKICAHVGSLLRGKRKEHRKRKSRAYEITRYKIRKQKCRPFPVQMMLHRLITESPLLHASVSSMKAMPSYRADVL